MSNKEEILKKLLKNLLEERIRRLEKRELQERKDLKIAKDAYNKQGILLKKLCSVKIDLKKNSKRSLTHDKFLRSRNKTPNSTLRKGDLASVKDKNVKRSKTPNIIMRKKKADPKDKNNNLRKAKTPLKTTKKVHNSNTTKVPSYMAGTSTTFNKSKKIINKSTSKRTLTQDLRRKNKSTDKIKRIETNINDDKNLKLIDLKVEEMRDYVPMEEKNQENKEEHKKEKKICLFEKIMENNKIINSISEFLDDETQYNLFSCNKKTIKFLNEKLINSLEILKKRNNVSSTSTIQDQINSLKSNYKNEEYNAEPQQFSLSKATVKAIELLNEDSYNKIFRNKELPPNINEIIIVYRIFFQFLKDNSIKDIKDDKSFWSEASEYILRNNNGKTGDFFKNSINNFDFNIKNIYKIKKLTNGNEEKLKPSSFPKVCPTTQLIVFLIKDTFEYTGIIHNLKKCQPSILLKYLEYINDIQKKIETYIDNNKKINNNL